MSALYDLRKAQDLIRDPSKWTQGSFAKTKDGEELVNGYDAGAVCWCAYGATEFVSGQFTSAAEDYLRVAANELGKSVVKVNDEDGHAAVMRLYDRAIELAEQAQ